MNPVLATLRALTRKRGTHHAGRKDRRPLHKRIAFEHRGYRFGPGRFMWGGRRGKDADQ